MVEIKKKEINFKKNVKKFYEKLIELNIPIIIVSGGIKEIILEVLKLLEIKGLEDYIEKKRRRKRKLPNFENAQPKFFI